MSSCLSSRSTTFESHEELSVDALKDLSASGTQEAGNINTWSSFVPRPTHVTSQHTTFETSPGTAVKRSSARREAELIHAQGRISQLELELSKCQYAAKRARIETSQEEEEENKATSTSQELQRLHTVGRRDIGHHLLKEIESYLFSFSAG